MAEAAITAIAKSALQLFSPLAKDEFLLLWKSGKELKTLENTIETISYLLYDTDKLQSKEKSVQNCLSKLRDVMYDAEEFFDALRWRVLHETTMGESETVVFSKKKAKWLHDNVPWKSLASLQTLAIFGLRGMEQLPDGFQHLTSVWALCLGDCDKVRSVPNWIPQLTSLRCLVFDSGSEELKKRCEKERGEDWPLIRHIPYVYIYPRINEESQVDNEPENEERGKIGWCGLFK